MLKLRHVFIALGMLLTPATVSAAQLSIGIGLPSVSIGFTLREYPDFVVVPGYPVYYAPQLEANLFFYDGMYWIYLDDNWYESTWYDGPWYLVDPIFVPEFVLRIPVRYYRRPPVYFSGWRFDAPPRWGDHWGHAWERRRGGWDKWNRHAAPAPAPLPIYQRQYSGERYPRQVEQQLQLQERNYRYQPRDPVVRQHYQEQRAVQPPPEEGRTRQQNIERPAREIKPAPRAQPPQRESEGVQSPTPLLSPPRERQESQDRRQRQQPEEESGSRQNIQRLAPRQDDQAMPPPRAPEERRQDVQRPAPRQDTPSAPRPSSPQKGGEEGQRPTPFSPQQGRPESQERRQPPPPRMEQREQQQMPKSQGREEIQQGRDTKREPQREKGEERGRGRNE